MHILWRFYKHWIVVSTLFLTSMTWYSALQAATLQLTWADNSDNEDGFQIERLVAGLLDETLTVEANVNSYTDSGLSNGIVYCYRVKAFNSAGESASSNQACGTAHDTNTTVNMTATPTSITPGGTITVSWSGISAPTSTDWIGLYSAGAADTNFISWIYASCSTSPGSARASGSCSYVLPATLSGGSYELRLLANNGYTRLATTNSFTVTTGGSTPPSGGGTSPTLTVTPTTVSPGGTVTATWSGITAPTSTDWIGLYSPGAADTNFTSWIYVSCSMSPGSARASGSCSYVLPATLSGGSYELRLLANNGYTRLATTNSFTVTTGGSTPPSGGGTSPTLTVTPTTVSPGGTVTATWSGITAPTSTDWIGLYSPGAADTNFTSWIYVSCSMSPGSARASGSCSYVLPATLSGGSYELRLLANDGYTRLATSSAFSVSTSANDAGVSVLSAASSGGIGEASLSSITQGSNQWADYDLILKLKSTSSNSMGVMFRYQDDKNYYRFLWNRKSKFRRLEKVHDGVTNVLANDATGYITGQTYELEIVVQGPALRVLIDGSLIFSVTDSTFVGGTVGLYSSNNPGTIFDDVTVKDLATGVTLLSDNFNDGNFPGWTIVDQGTTQESSVWSAANGTLTQSSSTIDTFTIYTLRNWTDYRLTLKMQSMDRDFIGVMFRYQNNSNYYRFSWNSRNNVRRLEKRQDGVFTVLAEDIKGYVMGQTYHLGIVAKDTTLEVALDGALIFSARDSSFSGGTIALYSNSNQGSSFDDVLVEDLVTGAVLLQHDFNNGTFTGWTIVDDKSATQGPSAWSAQSGAFVQTSNIGSNSVNALGTYALY